MKNPRCAPRRHATVSARLSRQTLVIGEADDRPFGEHGRRRMTPPPQRTSCPSRQVAVMHAVRAEIGIEHDRTIPPLDGPVIGPAGTLPVLTPCGGDARRWYADFVFLALSSLSRSVRVWPTLLDRPWGRGRRGVRAGFRWQWLRFEDANSASRAVVGQPALDALLSACIVHPGLLAEIIGHGRYVRVPYLLIGDDRRADYPVLYHRHDTVALHTMARSREDLHGLRECALVMHH